MGNIFESSMDLLLKRVNILPRCLYFFCLHNLTHAFLPAPVISPRYGRFPWSCPPTPNLLQFLQTRSLNLSMNLPKAPVVHKFLGPPNSQSLLSLYFCLFVLLHCLWHISIIIYYIITISLWIYFHLPSEINYNTLGMDSVLCLLYLQVVNQNV